MSLPRINLAVVNHYSIDLTKKDQFTYSIQLRDLNEESILSDLSLDPMDNTLAAVIDKDTVSKLGADAASVLEKIATVLPEKIGVKEFIIVPKTANFPGFIPVQENTEFTRTRHANRKELEKSTEAILKQHSDLEDQLDKQTELVMGINELVKKIPHHKPYHEILALLETHADFTKEKMQEYEAEDVQGVKARFNGEKVTTIAMLNEQKDKEEQKNQKHLCAIVRCLAMGNKFGYLSDETVNQNILPLEKFPGNSPEEQMKERAKFLLAYIANRACKIATDQDNFLMIAARGREDIYDAVGFKQFPIVSDDYVVMMKFTREPRPLMQSIQKNLVEPEFSNVEAINRMGINAAASNVAEQQKIEEPTNSLQMKK